MDIRLTRKICPCKPKSTAPKFLFNADLKPYFFKHLRAFWGDLLTRIDTFFDLKNAKIAKIFSCAVIIIPRLGKKAEQTSPFFGTGSKH
ncbi:MAG: hypothetical protein UZ17_ACD001001791 [Acidobacteria bacterium OLB17]|nr:MAG: hypothetical protein UZ17_ACD001001791 [Acidobacteria bacterium OLB17]MCZ2390630.1 hypothetical protein [Acidobacteriota bacterium]